MNVLRSLQAIPTMVRVGLADVFAYRAQMIIWILSATLPLISLALWYSVASDAPIGRFEGKDMIAYFLSVFVVRQLTESWIAWTINAEVKDGALGLKLLHPVHPFLSYAAANFAEHMVRILFAIPLAAIALLFFAKERLNHDLIMWGIFVLSVIGAWTINLFVNFAIGCLALFIESAGRIMNAWLAFHFLFSGYLVPVELFPRNLKTIAQYLPFRYQLGFPVELMTGAHSMQEALYFLTIQWAMAVVFAVLAAVLWLRGIRRFAAYGG